MKFLVKCVSMVGDQYYVEHIVDAMVVVMLIKC